ncbi:MAG: hypothetical protein CBC23_003285 [Rhodospirillaceae bacterium TMED63]|nr:hypothetical protein [Rhodospirillaceae bacterium]RPG02489.1 MAG: hypothetical protein CBC23_003285 [Rhodospirillaceae bacterium TMED63]
MLSAPAASAKVWFEGGVFGSSALHGHNVVNHFTKGRSVEGQFKFGHSRMNTERLFTSTEHRACLLRVPKDMQRNTAAGGPRPCPSSTDPQPWRIVDGKL